MRVRLLLILCILAGLGFVGGCTAKKCVEKPRADCMCTREYDPVCGCNEKTYSNPCEAECHGITDYTKGACKEDRQ